MWNHSRAKGPEGNTPALGDDSGTSALRSHSEANASRHPASPCLPGQATSSWSELWAPGGLQAGGPYSTPILAAAPGPPGRAGPRPWAAPGSPLGALRTQPRRSQHHPLALPSCPEHRDGICTAKYLLGGSQYQGKPGEFPYKAALKLRTQRHRGKRPAGRSVRKGRLLWGSRGLDRILPKFVRMVL